MKFTVLLLFLFFTNSSWCTDTFFTFHESQFLLPKGFNQLSNEQLKTIRFSIGNRKVFTGFKNESEVNKLHRMMVYYDKLEGTKNMSFKEIVRLKKEIIEEEGVQFFDVQMDKKKYIVWGKALIHGDTSLFGFSVDLNGMMCFQFDNLTGINASEIIVFETILKSIQHKFQYQLVNEESNQVLDSKEKMRDNGYYFTMAFIIMAIVWFIKSVITKNIKKE